MASIHHGTPQSLPQDYAILSRFAALQNDDEANQPFLNGSEQSEAFEDTIPRRPTTIRSSFPSPYIHPPQPIMGLGPKNPAYSNATENTPLLAPLIPRIQEDVDSLADVQNAGNVKMFWEELAILAKYTSPVFITHLFEYSLTMASVVSIGHLSTTALAAATLGSMTANVSGFSILQGLASTLDTMLPGAWTSSQPELVGLWSQRMAVIMSATLIPILTVWFNAEAILLTLKQEPEVAQLAALYLKWTSIGLPAYAINLTSRRYFQSQGLFDVPTRIILVVAPINVLLNYLLVWGPEPFRLGFIGAPIATAISFNLVSIASVIYGIFFVPKTAWHPLSMRCFTSLGVLVQLGIAGVGQTASEWWSWELIGLAASLLGPTALATQSVLLVSASTTFQAPFSLSVATSVRIGNLLGEKKAKRAGVAANTSIVMAVVIAAFWSTLFLTFRKSWAHMFNDDPEVVELVASILPLVSLFQVFDGVSAVTAGVLRARGKQFTGALLNLTAYYIIGIPFGVWLTFRRGMELYGLWAGLTVSLVYCSGWGVYLCLTSDWEREVKKLMDRLDVGNHGGNEDAESRRE